MLSAHDAIERLRAGNRRFVEGLTATGNLVLEDRRAELLEGQSPFAIVLGCSDSRVPSEMVFGQGLGDLFVIRVAGNIVAPSQIASVEFAAATFGTRLVVVLGHSMCGAVAATLKEMDRPAEDRSPHLAAIVDRIRPAVEVIADTGEDELLAEAIRANIRASVEHLRHGSDILEGLIRTGGLQVVGAEYSLETGLVEFFRE